MIEYEVITHVGSGQDYKSEVFKDLPAAMKRFNAVMFDMINGSEINFLSLSPKEDMCGYVLCYDREDGLQLFKEHDEPFIELVMNLTEGMDERKALGIYERYFWLS